MKMSFIKSDSRGIWDRFPWVFAIAGLLLASVWMGAKISRGRNISPENESESTAPTQA